MGAIPRLTLPLKQTILSPIFNSEVIIFSKFFQIIITALNFNKN